MKKKHKAEKEVVKKEEISCNKINMIFQVMKSFKEDVKVQANVKKEELYALKFYISCNHSSESMISSKIH
jgi:hypothetical protein